MVARDPFCDLRQPAGEPLSGRFFGLGRVLVVGREEWRLLLADIKAAC
jgi:hypothetical protein